MHTCMYVYTRISSTRMQGIRDDKREKARDNGSGERPTNGCGPSIEEFCTLRHYSVSEIPPVLPLFKEVTNRKQDSWHV